MRLQALPAFDDEDFHEGHAPLPLAALRGVATALNTLVYHTQCAAAGPAPGKGDAAAARMLRRWPCSCSLTSFSTARPSLHAAQVVLLCCDAHSCSYPHSEFRTATPLLHAVFPVPASSHSQQTCLHKDRGR